MALKWPQTCGYCASLNIIIHCDIWVNNETFLCFASSCCHKLGANSFCEVVKRIMNVCLLSCRVQVMGVMWLFKYHTVPKVNFLPPNVPFWSWEVPGFNFDPETFWISLWISVVPQAVSRADVWTRRVLSSGRHPWCHGLSHSCTSKFVSSRPPYSDTLCKLLATWRAALIFTRCSTAADCVVFYPRCSDCFLSLRLCLTENTLCLNYKNYFFGLRPCLIQSSICRSIGSCYWRPRSALVRELWQLEWDSVKDIMWPVGRCNAEYITKWTKINRVSRIE